MAENDVLENEVKHYVFVKNGCRHFDPQYLTAGETTVERIFPTPVSNAVGTLDEHNNGIVFIKFNNYGKELECKIVAQNFSKTVFGSFYYRFCPNFSKDTIVYSKTNVVVVANVKTNETFHAKCGLFMGDYITGIRFLDMQKNLFVIVKSIEEGGKVWENYLHIMKLGGQQFIDIGSSIHIGETRHITPDFPLYHEWFVHENKLFVYNNGRISCTNGNQQVLHPFSEIFNENSERFGNIKDLAVHPTLPFGVMIEDHFSGGISHQLTVVYWKAKKPKNQILAFDDVFEPLAPLFGLKSMAFAYQSFSPDGNWYVVGCLSPEAATIPEKPKDPFFIAIPIDDERSDFLDVDNLVVLGQVKNMASLAWTTGPTSYVVSNGELLHKWDLDELPDVRVFVMPEDGGKKKGKSIFGKIGGLFRFGD
jgi:hypothetical protein